MTQCSCYSAIGLLPKLFTIGSFYLPTYGVLVALGFLAGLSVTSRLAKRAGLNAELVTNLAIYVALSGMLGAKLLMLVFDWRETIEHPGEIFTLRTLQAAGVFQGGLILALVTAFFYIRRHGLPLLPVCDTFAPGLALGHAIGRLGCFAAGCCWGLECGLPWAVKFHDPEAWTLTGVPLEIPLHPSQLYEFGTELILFGVLYQYVKKNPAPGRTIGWYLVVSSVARFAIEFTRFHEQALPFGLPLSITQWIAVALAGLGAVILFSPSARLKPALQTSR